MFRRPLRFNEVAVVHAKFDLDDHDQKSQPFVSISVVMATDVLRWAIELTHKESMPAAILERRPLTAPDSAEWDYIQDVEFNTVTRTYEYYLHSPKMGYDYRLKWDGNAVVGTSNALPSSVRPALLLGLQTQA